MSASNNTSKWIFISIVDFLIVSFLFVLFIYHHPRNIPLFTLND
ncbi:hypothetical protein LTSEINV_6386 [Salmonella enterica subsp. enterica serovar Inverness str. R8-3668]|uniref:Uncharacterized protein n=1 Tax=Salmonella enterica subsp. enterica serovar Inverness str. R8-3668 TaxID=913075 RepID=G5NMK7_SALET|nr:hypothetical protein LTSEINV_6386 [Salmonella enterica subsp. enterica serovar Inverness str. R8-3668]